MGLNRETIFLIGFMGSGKTTVGQELAKELGYEFKDLDAFIVESVEKTIPEIFTKYGEKGFRKLEKKALKELTVKSNVVATGGGVIETEGTLGWMRNNGIAIFLDAPFDILYERIKEDKNRPLSSIGEKELLGRYEKRKPLYDQAPFAVDTNEKTVQQIVQEIHLLLKKKE
ncbi:shikimate kinase [Salipaludibacillus daqingensis]|uniref:shikimate kinase n=1 Tax=Salipaludibacillus daqingensis TaxID=3041001 RepID=UPI002474FDDC|nr:shikimate kinase [Salipaludibacillus daqingensis]